MSGPLQLPDPSALRDQLEQAQAARAQLDRIVAWLEEGIQIFAPPAPTQELEAAPAADPVEEQPAAVDEPPAGAESPARPRPTARRPAQRPSAAPPVRSATATNRDREAKILSALLHGGRRLSKPELVDLTGLTTHELRRPLERLVSDGRVIAEGATKARRYRAPKVGEDLPFHSQVRVRQEATAQRNAAKVTDAVARVGLRDRVMKAILADPDALTEERLALALNADRDDIAEACGWLLERHRVLHNPDGTYRRHPTRAEAA